MRDFPLDFLWGSATAAHQVEGGNVGNDWWVWEQTAGTQAVEPSAAGIDHLRRYDDDFALLASLGQNAHRFSLEWSRIEPADGVISQEALAHYRQVLESLHRHGLVPVVTLYHKTLPLWFADSGGWLAPDAVDRFGRYAEVVRDALGDLMPYVCTVNEPQIIALFGYLTGTFPPALSDPAAATQVNATLMAAHRRAVQVFRQGPESAKIGTCLQLIPMQPLRPADAADLAATAQLQELVVDAHLRDLAAGGDVGDFVGLQYYTRAYVDAAAPGLLVLSPGDGPTTQMGWEVHPDGFGEMLRRLAAVGLPVLVTENGIATADDAERVDFLRAHLAELKSAIDDGVPLLGYLHWSAFDNFEWNHGYAPTFGLIAVDRDDDYRRTPRDSAYLFGEIARTGSLHALTGRPMTVAVAP
ncbi:MAG: glycosyl hydrolase [Frankiales bacterium]|nr:glycosyl hydrolase [Frankiales bacterium]